MSGHGNNIRSALGFVMLRNEVHHHGITCHNYPFIHPVLTTGTAMLAKS